MNYYLLFGLTLLMCLVVTVIYMPKYNFREVVVCILVWTIIGTMCVAAFILAFPKVPVAETVIKPIVTEEVKPEEVVIPIDTSSGDARVFYDKFDQEYDNNNATTAQKDDILRDFSFRKVRWTGAVGDVEDEMIFGYWSISVDIGNDDRFVARIEHPSAEVKAKLLSLKKGEEITIEGTTELMLWSWKLNDAKIIE